MPDINIILADMPCTIRSYVVSNPDFSYTIVLNSRLSHEQNLLSYSHEMAHIQNGDYDKKCDVNILEIGSHESERKNSSGTSYGFP